MADVIPFDQRDGSLWYDGKLVPWKDAKTHVLTHGLHYGSCVFEGQRIYGGTIYKLKEHTAAAVQVGRDPGHEDSLHPGPDQPGLHRGGRRCRTSRTAICARSRSAAAR